MSLECSVDEKKNDQYVLKVNDQRVIPVDDYSYNGYGESAKETGNATLVMTSDELKSSLGLARLMTLCVTPFVPRTADYKSNLMTNSVQRDTTFITETNLVAYVSADTTYYPSPLSFQLIKNGGMMVSYADVNFKDDDLNKKDVCYYRGWESETETGTTTLGQLIKSNVDFASYLNVSAYELSQNAEPKVITQISGDVDPLYYSSVTQNKMEVSLTDIGVKWGFPKEQETKKVGGIQEQLMVKMRGNTNGQPVSVLEEEIAIPEKRTVSQALAKAMDREVKTKMKQLSKEGWQSFYSDKPIDKQLEYYYMLLDQYDDEYYPKYFAADAQSIGYNNELLKIESMEQAKHNLVESILFEVSNSIDEKVENQQLQPEQVESLKQSLAVAYINLFQSLGKAKPMLEMYHYLPEGNKKVQVSIVCNRDMAKKVVKDAVRQDLQKHGDKLYEIIDQLF